MHFGYGEVCVPSPHSAFSADISTPVAFRACVSQALLPYLYCITIMAHLSSVVIARPRKQLPSKDGHLEL